jgi:hypothetical protein
MEDIPNEKSSYKLVAILNKRIEPGKVMNALAHCVAGAVNLLGEQGREALKFLDFVDADGQKYPSISARSFIVLRGSDGDIRKIRQQALEASVSAVCFTESMTGGTYVEQILRTKTTPTSSLVFYAIVLVGDEGVLRPLTKRCSLWRGGDSPNEAAMATNELLGNESHAQTPNS